jgi:hypothetical protein
MAMEGEREREFATKMGGRRIIPTVNGCKW